LPELYPPPRDEANPRARAFIPNIANRDRLNAIGRRENFASTLHVKPHKIGQMHSSPGNRSARLAGPTATHQRRQAHHSTSLFAPLLRACAIALTASALAPLPASPQDVPPSPLSIPPRTWAVDCARNEVLVIQHPGSFLRYRFHVVDEKGDQLRDQIETPDGGVARVIQRDGRPLTPDEDAAERERLNALIAAPADFARHIHREMENKRLGINLLNVMPDAMLWSYTPGQPQLPTQSSPQPASPPAPTPPLVVLDFKPNPNWTPPNFESEPLTGLEGRVWIDPRARRVVHLEGDLFHAVNIGWGLVAHLYPGGKVLVQQTNVAGDRWIVEHIDEQITLRALMVKTVKQRLVYDTFNYQPVPPMSYQQAIKVLLDTPLPNH
jgi:hypothetical protein